MVELSEQTKAEMRAGAKATGAEEKIAYISMLVVGEKISIVKPTKCDYTRVVFNQSDKYIYLTDLNIVYPSDTLITKLKLLFG